MKTLVIHIGWPKTATSTIQDCFFRELYEQGEINYLGKYTLAQKGKVPEVWNPWDDFVLHCVYGKRINDKSLRRLQSYLRDGINVLSNEDFPLSFFGIKERKFLPETDPIIVPARIESLASKLGADTVKIIATVRNQPDAIYSTYVEGWRWFFRHESSLRSFRNYLHEGISKGFRGVFRMFFYSEILAEYRSRFGSDNVEVLFFEDIKNDASEFSRDFVKYIGNKYAKRLEDILLSNKRNVKQRDERGRYLTDSPSLYEELWVRWRALVPEHIHSVLKHSPLPKIARSVFGRLRMKEGICIDPLSDEERIIVFKLFHESNRKLSEFVSSDKLMKYGYI